MRYIRFGKRLASKYKCVWWTADFSHSEKKFRSLIHADGKNEIVIQRNLSIRLVPTTGYKKNISVRRVLFEINYASNLRKIWEKEDTPDLIITPGTGVITAFRPV